MRVVSHAVVVKQMSHVFALNTPTGRVYRLTLERQHTFFTTRCPEDPLVVKARARSLVLCRFALEIHSDDGPRRQHDRSCRGGPGRGTTADRPAYGGGAGPRRVHAGTTRGGGERGERGAYRAEAPFSEPRQRSGVATGACQGTSLEEAKEEAGDEGQSCPQ